MSTASTSLFGYIANEINIYVGIFSLTAGIIGGTLSIIVFLSLKIFRKSSCAFYLSIMSVFNIVQMLTGFLGIVMTNGFNTEVSQSPIFYCKFRFYSFQVCALTSMTCVCLATIDQYFATCIRPRWQQWCNMKLARGLVLTFVPFWMLHNILYLIYYEYTLSTKTGKLICVVTNSTFQLYVAYGVVLVLGKFLPICITFFFGYLVYRNIQQLTYRTFPLVRRELEKQLTVMVLLLVVVAFFTLMPYAIIYILLQIPSITSNPVILAQLQFTSSLTLCLVYMYFASPFYIFVSTSNRFRRQLIYVLFNIHLNRWRRHRRIMVNQVMPQI